MLQARYEDIVYSRRKVKCSTVHWILDHLARMSTTHLSRHFRKIGSLDFLSLPSGLLLLTPKIVFAHFHCQSEADSHHAKLELLMQVALGSPALYHHHHCLACSMSIRVWSWYLSDQCSEHVSARQFEGNLYLEYKRWCTSPSKGKDGVSVFETLFCNCVRVVHTNFLEGTESINGHHLGPGT